MFTPEQMQRRLCISDLWNVTSTFVSGCLAFEQPLMNYSLNIAKVQTMH